MRVKELRRVINFKCDPDVNILLEELKKRIILLIIHKYTVSVTRDLSSLRLFQNFY